MLAETLDIAHVRTLETENRLIVITDGHDIWIVVVVAS